ncbi:MAG: hypothetical protein HYZ75_19835 [Elusimicrobia bacterium]|nr:hypothetical protein [Elusimicrobiota bacterium]
MKLKMEDGLVGGKAAWHLHLYSSRGTRAWGGHHVIVSAEAVAALRAQAPSNVILGAPRAQ